MPNGSRSVGTQKTVDRWYSMVLTIKGEFAEDRHVRLVDGGSLPDKYQLGVGAHFANLSEGLEERRATLSPPVRADEEDSLGGEAVTVETFVRGRRSPSVASCVD